VGVAAVLAAVLIGAGTARAGTITYSTLTDAQKAVMKPKILTWESAVGDDLTTGMFRAASAGGVEGTGALAAGVTGITIVAGAYTVYRLLDAAGSSNYIYRKITGQAISGSAPNVGSPYWYFVSGQYQQAAGYAIKTDVWLVKTTGNYGPTGCNPTTAGSGCPTVPYSELWGVLTAFPRTLINTNTTSTNCGQGVVATNECPMFYSTQENLAKAVLTSPATATDYANAPTTKRYTAPGSKLGAMTDAQLQSALAGISSDNAALQDARDAAAVNYLREQAGLNTPVQILKPQINETYSTYITRLQAAGLTGSYTTTVEPTVLSGYGPDAVTRVQYADGVGATQTLDPLQWPTTAPSLAPSTAITVRYNPSTATPVATAGGGAAAGSETGPAGTVPAIDWSPLNVGLGQKFPFGAFTWVQTLFGNFGGSGALPCWTISKPSGLGSGGWTVCVPSNPYRSYSDPIMKLIAVVASLWFAGTWIVGWGRGDAMDGAG
jgi:hypothetical protein